METFTLKTARWQFTKLLAQLIQRGFELGYFLALDEGMDRLTAKDPTTDHLRSGLHTIGLAQDINLYDEEGNWLSKTEDHEALGLFWESLHPHCRWGGRFQDGNHYSFAPPEIVGNRA